MRREAHIPLFLWITAAVVVHGIGGEGATTVAERLEEAFDIQSFAKQVRRQASYAGPPMEVTLFDDEHDLDDLLEPEVPPEVEQPEPRPDEVEVDKEEEVLPEEQKKEKEKEKEKEELEKKQKEKEKEPQPTPPTEAVQPQKPAVPDNRRIAVEQDVQDKNQDDNENAEFAGEYANRVTEQTRAKMSASDGATSQAQMGGPSAGTGPEVGNSDNNKFAQSEASDGSKEAAPGDMSAADAEKARASTAQQSQSAADAVAASSPKATPSSPPPQSGRQEQQAQAQTEAQTAIPETYASSQGSYAVARAQQEQAQMRAQAAQKALPGRSSALSPGMFGLGATGTTERGINLNLNFQSARTVLGADHLSQVRKKSGERRLSEHRGKWESLGLERWRPALENYVANVKPGNQTALNTARVPFARYLNDIHQRLHEIFADRFLGHLDQLPADHPLNNREMSTHLEIALSREDGRVVRMGITKSSGVTAFDVGALDAVQRAAPYGPPPNAILSSDGNVYLHWEFHRKPEYACSTYFARPFIIDLGQQSAPPRVQPKDPPAHE